MGARIARIVAAAWMLMTLGGLVVGAAGWTRGRDLLLDDSPGCIFKWATGVDCPLCGMTHATVELGAGDLAAAQRAHPLAIVVLIGAFALSLTVAIGRADALLEGRRLIAILLAIVAIWALRLLL